MILPKKLSVICDNYEKHGGMLPFFINNFTAKFADNCQFVTMHFSQYAFLTSNRSCWK